MPRSLRITATFLYFLVCCYLFTMPGTALPKEDWLDKIYFDKWVHIGLFGLLALLVCSCGPFRSARALWIVGLLFSAYGLGVEFVQDRWIPHRSFDLWDWAADVVGTAAGLWAWMRFLPARKKAIR